MVHLHVRSWFSFLAGGLFSRGPGGARAQALGHRALALTDLHGMYGAVRFASACRAAGIRPVLGATLLVGDPPRPLILLAQDGDGYESLCRLATAAHGHGPPASRPPRPGPGTGTHRAPHLPHWWSRGTPGRTPARKASPPRPAMALLPGRALSRAPPRRTGPPPAAR